MKTKGEKEMTTKKKKMKIELIEELRSEIEESLSLTKQKIKQAINDLEEETGIEIRTVTITDIEDNDIKISFDFDEFF